MDLTHFPDLPPPRRQNFISTSAEVLPATLNATIRRKAHATTRCTLELLMIKPAVPHRCSSLKGPSPSAPPVKPREAWSGSDTRTRHRLPRWAAAWTHLRPMTAAPGPRGGNFFRRQWRRVADLIGFFCRNVFGPSRGRVGLPGFGSRECGGLKCVLA